MGLREVASNEYVKRLVVMLGASVKSVERTPIEQKEVRAEEAGRLHDSDEISKGEPATRMGRYKGK